MDYQRGKKCCNFVKIQVQDVKCFVFDSYLTHSLYVFRYLKFKWLYRSGHFQALITLPSQKVRTEVKFSCVIYYFCFHFLLSLPYLVFNNMFKRRNRALL